MEKVDKKKNKKLSFATRLKILYLLNAFLSLLTLVAGFLCLMFESTNEYGPFLALAAMLIVLFVSLLCEVNAVIFKRTKRSMLESLPLAGLYTIMLILFISLDNFDIPVFCGIMMMIYITSRLGKAIYFQTRYPGKRRIVAIVVIGLILAGCLTYLGFHLTDPANQYAFNGVFFIVEGFCSVGIFMLSGTNPQKLIKVLIKTHVIEVILGLILLMVMVSVALPFIEENVNGFGDGMWFCFATVTTIGYGDVTVTTMFGRLISIILGIYGIVVVALITSVIVNLYNESKDDKNKAAEKQTDQVAEAIAQAIDPEIAELSAEEAEIEKEEEKEAEEQKKNPDSQE